LKEVQDVLKELIKVHGDELVNEPTRLKGLLLDNCKHGRDLNLILKAMDLGVPVQLLEQKGTAPEGALLSNLRKRLYDDIGMDQRLAHWTVKAWALALGFDLSKEKEPDPPPPPRREKKRDPPPRNLLETLRKKFSSNRYVLILVGSVFLGVIVFGIIYKLYISIVSDHIVLSPESQYKDVNINYSYVPLKYKDTDELKFFNNYWIELKRGNKKSEFYLTRQGNLFYKGKLFTNQLRPLSDNIFYKLIFSPSSPLGNYFFIIGCEGVERGDSYDAFFCSHIFLIDLKRKLIRRTYAGRYGPEQIIQWCKDEYYATFEYINEGWLRYYRINLETGRSQESWR